MVRPTVDPCWRRWTLTGSPASKQARALRRAAGDLAAHRYDLAAGPLLRARLEVRLPEHRWHLLLGMHHIVCDNTSWSILLDEVATRYAHHATGVDGPLTPLPVPFADYARHQRDSSPFPQAVEPHLTYWRERLGTHRRCWSCSPTTRVPRSARRRRVPVAAARHRPRCCRTGAGPRRSHHPFAVLLAGFAALLHTESGQSDLVLGVPTAGREQAELAPLIGCFADLLPLRVDVAGRPTFRQLVARAYRTAREAYRRRGFRPWCWSRRAARQTAHHPLFQCVLNVIIDGPDEVPEFAGLTATGVEVPSVGVDFELFLSLTWQGEELHADLAYRADLLNRSGWSGCWPGWGVARRRDAATGRADHRRDATRGDPAATRAGDAPPGGRRHRRAARAGRDRPLLDAAARPAVHPRPASVRGAAAAAARPGGRPGDHRAGPQRAGAALGRPAGARPARRGGRRPA